MSLDYTQMGLMMAQEQDAAFKQQIFDKLNAIQDELKELKEQGCKCNCASKKASQPKE